MLTFFWRISLYQIELTDESSKICPNQRLALSALRVVRNAYLGRLRAPEKPPVVRPSKPNIILLLADDRGW